MYVLLWSSIQCRSVCKQKPFSGLAHWYIYAANSYTLVMHSGICSQQICSGKSQWYLKTTVKCSDIHMYHSVYLHACSTRQILVQHSGICNCRICSGIAQWYMYTPALFWYSTVVLVHRHSTLVSSALHRGHAVTQ